MHWLDGHLNQCVLIAMELHWTTTMHGSLVSAKPIYQLKLNMYVQHSNPRLLLIRHCFIHVCVCMCVCVVWCVSIGLECVLL